MFFSLIKDINNAINNWINYQTDFNNPQISHKFQAIWEMGILFLVKVQSLILYFWSFKWLEDFAYLPVSLPPDSNLDEKLALLPSSFLENWNWENVLVKIIGQLNLDVFFSLLQEDKKMFDSFFDSNNLWSLSILYPSWFDSISTPVHFLTTSKSSDLQELNLFNLLIIGILIGFSSFLNSFLINFPLSVSNILSLRYFMIQNPSVFSSPDHQWNRNSKSKTAIINSLLENISVASVSVLGIVFGELCFMFFLILPPPFIQISLAYLESILPYFLGISLIVFIIWDACNTNLLLFWKFQLNKNLRNNNLFKIFGFCFLLSLTEQSCCFSYFGSLNLSSTANFLDTYLFSASLSPIILIFSCLGFLTGSFFAITIYNFCLSQLLYLIFFFFSKKSTSYLFEKIKNFLGILNQNRIKWNSTSGVESVSGLNTTMGRNFGSTVSEFTLIIYNSLKSLIENFVKLLNFLFFSIIRRNKNKSLVFSSANTLTFSPSAREKEFLEKSKKMKKDNDKIVILAQIDKFLLTCLITLSFTTIPYYSFDYLANKFLGFLPSDENLNRYSLNVNLPDYSGTIGVVAENEEGKSQFAGINMDVSLYDRAYYMYGFWPNSFESLNYQNELMWTDVKSHDKSKKKNRRVNRKTFEQFKTKVFTSWRKFKKKNKFRSGQKDISLSNYKNMVLPDSDKLQSDLENFSKDTSTKNELNSSHGKIAFNKREKNNENLGSFFSTLVSKKMDKIDKNPDNFWLKKRSLENPINWLSKKTFRNLRLNPEKTTGSYRDSVKILINEKYYKNPIYKTILSSDLKKFLKREPLSQQLTNFQEKDLAFLRLKMAHYYDSLRFYFAMEQDINEYPININHSRSAEKNSNDQTQNYQTSYYGLGLPPFISKSITSLNYRQQFQGSYDKVRQLFEISLNKDSSNIPPVLSKEISSSGKEPKEQSNFFSKILPSFLKKKKLDDLDQGVVFSRSSQKGIQEEPNSKLTDPTRRESNSRLTDQEPILSYDKYLFNEYPYNKNSFLHEEDEKESDETSLSLSQDQPSDSLKEETFELFWSDSAIKKSKTKKSNLVKKSTFKPDDNFMTQTTDFNKTTSDNIHDMFGFNNPFYVGWDQDLRKFILTSRILPRTSSLTKEIETDDSLIKSYPNYTKDKDPLIEKYGKDDEKYKDYSSLVNQPKNNKTKFYQFYSSWPFLKHQLENSEDRSYSVLYADREHIENNKLQCFKFDNDSVNNLNTQSLTTLYDYYFQLPHSYKSKKREIQKLPINIYKRYMVHTSHQSLFTPTSNSFLWPGSTKPDFEIFFSELYQSLLKFFYSPL